MSYNKYKVFQPFVVFSQGFSIFDLGRTLRAAKADVLSKISTDPVKTNNFEVGFYSSLFDRIELNASYFHTYSKLGSDLKIENGFWVVNRTPQKVYGVEMSLDAKILENLKAGGSFVWMEGKVKNNGSDWDGYMSNLSIPAPKTTFHVRYNPTPATFLMLQYVHTGSRNRFAPNASGVYNKGEGVVKNINLYNFSAGLRLKQFDFNLGIENLFNQTYYTPASMLMARDAEYARGNGRYVTLTATFKY